MITVLAVHTLLLSRSRLRNVIRGYYPSPGCDIKASKRLCCLYLVPSWLWVSLSRLVFKMWILIVSVRDHCLFSTTLI